eukprot:TRINITY_DN66358_c5_g1_i1.p1 TRINITY_DN66358_c5_g1~~TRINITY_DN66358_c5_g1_i1.p1  ORF type:complete len:332 (+),score=138.05 TRINITY_DN66358_c5_g1_i1:50-1045(+)
MTSSPEDLHHRSPVLMASRARHGDDDGAAGEASNHKLPALDVGASGRRAGGRRELDSKNRKAQQQEEELTGNTTVLAVVFVVSIVLMYTAFANLPQLSAEEYEHVKFPRNVQDLRDLNDFLQRYRERHYWPVLSGFCIVYIFLQAFAIPGAIFLSILAGPLFGIYTGLFIVSCVATSGAAICYMMSYYLGRGLVQRCFPTMLAKFRQKIALHRHNLFFYLLFLRVSPLLPNWFISVSSPILNVPLRHFVGATLIGLIPANYIHVTTGMTLSRLQSVHESTMNVRAILTLFFIAFLALIPTFFRRKFEEFDSKLEKKGASAAVELDDRTVVN